MVARRWLAEEAAVTGISHEPHRPSWVCTGCGRPWPCFAARAALAASHDPIMLAVHMTDQLHQAAGELKDATPQELFGRFLAWTRYRSAAP